jgi:hypothetical protein
MMGAFIVEDKTINYFVNWLRREIDRLSLIPDKLKQLGFDTSTQAGQKFWDMRGSDTYRWYF